MPALAAAYDRQSTVPDPPHDSELPHRSEQTECQQSIEKSDHAAKNAYSYSRAVPLPFRSAVAFVQIPSFILEVSLLSYRADWKSERPDRLDLHREGLRVTWIW